ncbi:MAG: endonuclease/exonuclease/phosphatase family protein [Pseudomonadota bacterium]
MKIMCLNGWGGKLHESLLPYLHKEAPDVLCLQEVVHSPLPCEDWLTYRDGDHVLRQRANFFRDVQAVLPNHVATFCPAAQGSLWNNDQPVPSQWGLATFIHEECPVIAQVQGFVHKDYSPVGFGEHPRSRTAHAVRVYDYRAQRAIGITHMHGLRDLRGKQDTPERTDQARRLLALATQVAEGSDVNVVCGDFNVEPESETLNILGEAGYVELVTTRGFTSTRTTEYKKPGKFADYLLIDNEQAVRGFEVVSDPVVSDHCPLVLTL